MKKAYGRFALIVFLCMALFSAGIGQVAIGLKGGLNLSSLKGIDVNSLEFENKTGYHAGFYGNIHLGKKLGLQTEIVYSTQGGSINDGLQVTDVDLNYVNVPVMLKYGGLSGFYLEAGPQFGFRTNEVDFDDLSATINKSDLSVCGGVGYMGRIPLGIGLRYNLGLSKVGELDTAEVAGASLKSGVFQLSIYWRLMGK